MTARPPILFLAAFGAGLATGLAHFSAPIDVALVLGVATVAALASTLTAGSGVGRLCLGVALVGALHGASG